MGARTGHLWRWPSGYTNVECYVDAITEYECASLYPITVTNGNTLMGVMTMRKHLVLISLIALSGLFISVISVNGQRDDLSVVYVTTQDNAALRAGPGRDWDRLAVLPFATTYRATGRTLD